jgi:hypothetical protein
VALVRLLTSNPPPPPPATSPPGPGQGKLIDHGVHAFVVPLRDDSGKLLPGVEIHDCGYKVGRGAPGCVWA